MFDKQKALENAQRKLATQQASLKQTLDEIDYVEKNAPNATALIKSLRVKRDRQTNTIAATEQTIELYAKPDPAQLDIMDKNPHARAKK